MLLDSQIHNALSQPLKEYFDFFQNLDYSTVHLTELTSFFADVAFVDRKPYLYRREIRPKDQRFSQIEIVFNDDKKIEAITWDINLKLKDLVSYFGSFRMQQEPMSNTTAFIFEVSNPQIEIIKTRCPGLLDEKSPGLKSDLNFKFIQFNIH